MDIMQLRYFIAVAQQLNFTAAANQFFITQPTISRQINLLESELHAQLFVRNTHRVQLTDAGQEFFIQAIGIIRQVETAVRRVQDIAGGGGHILKIAAFISSEDVLYHDLNTFSKKRPGIQTNIDFFTGSEMTEALNEAKHDFYYVNTQFVRARADYQYIHRKCETSYFIVRPCDEEKISGQDFSGLADCPFVCISLEKGPALYNLLMRVCAALGFSPKIVGFYNRATSILDAVSMGMGITILPRTIAERSEFNNILLFPIDREEALVESCVSWRKQPQSVDAGAFLSILVEHSLSAVPPAASSLGT